MKTASKTARSAAQAAAMFDLLSVNADDYCAGRLTYEAFTATQAATWAAIEAAGPKVTALVLSAWRQGRPA